MGYSTHIYLLLHAVSPLCVVNAITLSSFYLQSVLLACYSLPTNNSTSKWIIRTLLCFFHPMYAFLFCSPNPILVVTVFALLLNSPNPTCFYGPFSFIYASTFPEFMEPLQSCITGVVTIPFAYSLLQGMISFTQFYLPIVCYGEGVHILAYSLLFLSLRSFPTAFCLQCLHCFAVSLYYDLCSEGDDVFALAFYIQCIACGCTCHLIAQQTTCL